MKPEEDHRRISTSNKGKPGRHTIAGAGNTAGWEPAEARRLKELEKENTRLKKLAADFKPG